MGGIDLSGAAQGQERLRPEMSDNRPSLHAAGAGVKRPTRIPICALTANPTHHLLQKPAFIDGNVPDFVAQIRAGGKNEKVVQIGIELPCNPCLHD